MGREKEMERKGRQLSEVTQQLPQNILQATHAHARTHTHTHIHTQQFQQGHRGVCLEMLSLRQGLANCVYDPFMGP